MIWGKSNKDEELKKLLKASGSDFRFDQDPLKYRLLSSIERMDQKPQPHFHMGRVAKYSVGFAGTVIILSATVSFASNSKPGDKLFALNKFGEQVVLKLPMSVEQKAKVETYIVTNRLQALDQVQIKTDKAKVQTDAKKLETVKETDETFSSAIDEISQNKQSLEKSGKTKDADKLETMLDNLQTMVQQREDIITKMRDETEDKTVRAKLQDHLQQLKKSRQKAQEQIKRFKNMLDQKDKDTAPPPKKTDVKNPSR